MIQTRHRIPETALREDQIIVYQVPQPEPLSRLEPSRAETRRMHALADYGLMHVKLYEDIARFGQVSISYDYPVMVNHRYLMSPSPIPAFDNPKMHMMPALQLFGAGREKRIYADAALHRGALAGFRRSSVPRRSARRTPAGCAARPTSYLDEVVMDDRGGRLFVCSDTDHCAERRAAGHVGADGHAGGRGMTDDTLLVGARADAVVRRHSGAGRGRCRSLARRDAGGRRRIRLRQDDAAERAVGPAAAATRRGVVSRSGRAAARRARHAGARACARCIAPTGASCTRTRGRTCA